MNQIESSIQFADRLFTQFSWEPETLEQLKKHRDFIASKYADSRLYLAVIGDFSSGKSTLINALCGYDCLKTGIMATTAIPTYIQAGTQRQPELIAELNDGRTYRLMNQQDALSFCQTCGITLNTDFRETLERVTTLEAVAQRANRITVQLPDNGLGSLCIIDTPGVNPGQENSELHVIRTKQVLEEVADSVVVLFPATQAYTHSFELFLKENAGKFMDNAVFLLTMMDRVAEEERQELEQYVRDSIREKMHVEAPMLISCSAYMADKEEYWCHRFVGLKDTIFAHMREQREQILSLRMAELLTRMLQVMQLGVAQQTQALKESLNVLEDNAPPHLYRTLDNIKCEETDRISSIRSAYATYEASLRTEMQRLMADTVQSRVASFKSQRDFSTYTDRPEGLTTDIASQTQKYYGYNDQICETARELVNWTNDHMLKELEWYYGRIGDAALVQKIASTALNHSMYEKIGESLSQVRQSFAKVDMQKTVLTSGSAAAIGLLIAGPIGLVVGGIAGYFGKDKLFLNKARTDFMQQVNRQLPTIVANIAKECSVRTVQYIDGCVDRIGEMKERYLAAYATLFQEALNAYEERKKVMGQRIAGNERCAKDIEERIQLLKQIKQGAN